MKDADFSKWAKPEYIAKILKDWAVTKNYPNDIYYKF
jgi:hypothetical protein